MGIIGVAFGLGFIVGPFLGGELGRLELGGRPGAVAAFAAAALSALNLRLAFLFLPESRAPDAAAPPAARRRSSNALMRGLQHAATRGPMANTVRTEACPLGSAHV